MSSEGSQRPIGHGWLVISVAPRPPGHEVRLGGPADVRVLVEPDPTRCFRRVGDWGVSYRGPDAPGALAAGAVADWLESRGAPVTDALRELAPAPVELGPNASKWPRVVAAHPPGTGYVAPPVELSDPDAWVRLRSAARAVAARDSFLTNVPVCLGGRASTQRTTDPRCAGCHDAGACVGPPGAVDVARLRPSPGPDGGTELRRAIEAIGHGAASASGSLETLLSAVGDRPYDIHELSYKVGPEGIRRGPRVTCYLPAHRSEAAAQGFVALGPAPGAAKLVDRLAAVAHHLPWHFGFEPGPDGVTAKLYLSVSDRDPGEVRALLDALGPLRGAEDMATRRIYVVGVALGPSGAMRIRAYPRVDRAVATDDPTADPEGSEGWNLSTDGPPVLEARYAHYNDSQLTWPEVCERVPMPPRVAAILERGFRPGICRYYFTQLGRAEDTFTIYAQVGPHPRDP